MHPSPDLRRFHEAQHPIYDSVVREIRAGHKVTHWMWFIFPQVRGLGRSETSRYYGITSLDEARAYLADPVLGPRLRECVGLLLASDRTSAVDIFGPTDAMKLRSSMSLFLRAAPADGGFAAVLDRYFEGVPDPATDALLG